MQLRNTREKKKERGKNKRHADGRTDRQTEKRRGGPIERRAKALKNCLLRSKLRSSDPNFASIRVQIVFVVILRIHFDDPDELRIFVDASAHPHRLFDRSRSFPAEAACPSTSIDADPSRRRRGPLGRSDVADDEGVEDVGRRDSAAAAHLHLTDEVFLARDVAQRADGLFHRQLLLLTPVRGGGGRGIHREDDRRHVFGSKPFQPRMEKVHLEIVGGGDGPLAFERTNPEDVVDAPSVVLDVFAVATSKRPSGHARESQVVMTSRGVENVLRVALGTMVDALEV